MADLEGELRALGGPGWKGEAAAALRFLPAAACGIAVPGTLLGQDGALALLVAGLLGVGAQVYAELMLRSGAPLPGPLRARR